MGKTWENASSSPKPNVQDEGGADGRRAQGSATDSLLLPKTWGCGCPIPPVTLGSGFEGGTEKATAQQRKGNTNTLKVNCVQ